MRCGLGEPAARTAKPRQRPQQDVPLNTPNLIKIVSFLTGRPAVRRDADAGSRCTLYIGLVVLAVLAPSQASAGTEQQPLTDIEQVAEEFLSDARGDGSAEAAPLDRRLQLPRCDKPLQPFMREGAQVRKRTIVGVRCNGTRPWKVYVPVSLVEFRKIVVLARSQPRGHELSIEDLELQRRDVSRLAGGYATDVSSVAGQRLKQSLRGGAVVTPAKLATKTLVRRGQSVTLSAEHDAIQIRVAGKALMDGALGQRIRVENVGSGRIVEGLVRSAELIEVLVQ